jgi:hypothetical protein
MSVDIHRRCAPRHRKFAGKGGAQYECTITFAASHLDDGIFHARQRVRRGAGRDRAVAVLVQVAAADAILDTAQDQRIARCIR